MTFLIADSIGPLWRSECQRKRIPFFVHDAVIALMWTTLIRPRYYERGLESRARMMSRRLPLWLSAVGCFLLVPGVLWFTTSGPRLNDDDESIAFQRLTQIHLKGADSEPLSATLIVPKTAQWAKIRKVWGEPEFVISGVDPKDSYALCLPEMPVRIEMSDPTGRVIPLQPHAAPYGYSTSCQSSSLGFHAAPGGTFTLKLTKTGLRGTPAGDLIVVSYWLNTKDNLVGRAIDRDVESLVEWLLIPGSLLVLSGAGIFLGSRARHRHRN